MSNDDESPKTKTASSTPYDMVIVDPSTGSMAVTISRRFHPIRLKIGKNSTMTLNSGTEYTVAGGGGGSGGFIVTSTRPVHLEEPCHLCNTAPYQLRI